MKAIVIKKVPYGESDLIIHFLLENGSLQSGFAAGGRRSQKRFPHQFHLAGVYDLTWSHAPRSQQQLTRIHRCELLEFFPQMTGELETLSRWATVMEWLALAEGSTFDFELILQLMKTLGTAEGWLRYHSFFIQQMLEHGLIPEMNQCTICARSIKPPAVFSLREGGLSHSQCASGVPISAATIQFLQRISKADIVSTTLTTVFADISEASLCELDRITVPFLEMQLGRSLRTQRFFELVQPQPGAPSVSPLFPASTSERPLAS